MGISLLTIVRNRQSHLDQLIEGALRSSRQPDELIIVDMSDVPIEVPVAPFPVIVDRFETYGLPLARARNRAAALAQFDQLVFLDVDCIPLASCIAILSSTLAQQDALVCADIRYLGPDDARGSWQQTELLKKGRPHPVRRFPVTGVREETNPGLFWSLAFALRRDRFINLRGFDEGFSGYGAEDTDFGFRAAKAALPLLFVGGAIACHQHHDSYDPPIQHLTDIVRNARYFQDRWHRWPMEGWLEAFAAMGLVRWDGSTLAIIREPTAKEFAAARIAAQSVGKVSLPPLPLEE